MKKLKSPLIISLLTLNIASCGVPVSSQKHNADVTVHYLPPSHFDSPKGIYSKPIVYPDKSMMHKPEISSKANLGSGNTKKNSVSNGGGTSVQ